MDAFTIMNLSVSILKPQGLILLKIQEGKNFSVMNVKDLVTFEVSVLWLRERSLSALIAKALDILKVNVRTI